MFKKAWNKAARQVKVRGASSWDRELRIIRMGLAGGGFAMMSLLGVIVGSSFGDVQKVGEETDFARVHLEERTRMQTFQEIAGGYDREIGMDEFFMGLWLLRRWMLRRAYGATLEVGAGTGRNLPYLRNATTLTCTDQSQEMLDVIQSKLPYTSLFTRVRSTFGWSYPEVVLKQTSTAAMDFPDNSFDTVVSTFGLCSYEDPAKALREMQRVCKPDGQILLLEHGLGSYDFINRSLSEKATRHAKKFGCVWNKPIGLIVDDSGLEIVKSSRWHFGTTYCYVAHPNKHHTPKAKIKRGVFSVA